MVYRKVEAHRPENPETGSTMGRWVRPTSCRLASHHARVYTIEYGPWVVPRALTFGKNYNETKTSKPPVDIGHHRFDRLYFAQFGTARSPPRLESVHPDSRHNREYIRARQEYFYIYIRNLSGAYLVIHPCLHFQRQQTRWF